MQAESQKGDGRQAATPSFDRKAAQQHKTPAFQDFMKDARQALFQLGQWEVFVTQGLPIDFRLGQPPASAFNLCKLGWGQALNPMDLVDNLGTIPSGVAIDFWWQFHHV
jgi:hypothetical protein